MHLTQSELELDTPSPGDIVTVRIRPPKAAHKALAGLIEPLGRGLSPPNHENINHYRHTAIWEVLAVNGAHAVVRARTGYGVGHEAEIWPIAMHRWFEAGELLAAVLGAE